MLYILLFLLSFASTYLIKNYALKKSLVAHVNERSSHTTPTPHGGGIAIAFTWFIGISYLYFYDEMNASLYFALMAGILLSCVSYVDDLYELSPKIRLFAQALVAFTALYFLGGFERIECRKRNKRIECRKRNKSLRKQSNFLDGIDGYAGSEAIFLALAAFILFGDVHFLVLASAVLGFLVWNWHRAKIFMGDVGSTLLGYNVAIFTLYYANEASVNFWIWIILFGVFWFDATLTLLRRMKNKEKLSQAHRKHAYQRLTQSGWSHQKVVSSAMIVNFILFALVYLLSNIFIAFAISLLLLYVCMRLVDTKKGFK